MARRWGSLASAAALVLFAAVALAQPPAKEGEWTTGRATYFSAPQDVKQARAPACAPAASVRAHDARCTAARAPARRPLGGARATLAHTSCTRALTPPWIKAAAA
jgi:hypothetical protein